MPNWTTNEVTMKGISKLNVFSINDEGRKYLDFNKIIPEPETKEECLTKYGPEYLDDGNKHLDHSRGKEWFDWYSWHCDFWGTKWNACDSYIEDEDTIMFDTAWEEPKPIFAALSKMCRGKELVTRAEYEGGFIYERTYLNGKEKSCTEINNSLDITLESVKQAYKDGVAYLAESPNGDGVVCKIGDNWFYFGGLTAEESTVEEFKAAVPEEDIIREIFDAIEEIGMDLDIDEYNYYALIFEEHGYI